MAGVSAAGPGARARGDPAVDRYLDGGLSLGKAARLARSTELSFWRWLVDVVIERGAGTVAGVEVKASATVTAADFRGLRKLKAGAGEGFAAGIVLCDGEADVRFAAGLYAISLRSLWKPCPPARPRHPRRSYAQG